MNTIKFNNLADCKYLVDQIARYWQAEWSSDKSASGFEKQKQSILKKLNRDRAPLILVAHRGDEFIGSAALFLNDLEARPDLSFWMGGIFTVPQYRGQGIAKALIEKIESKSKELGYNKIYLHTESAAGLYASLGWQKLCDTITDQGEKTEIYYKNL
ncbi:MAG: putative acetyltransferase [bacterium ADurb.Bin212]|nr:MAG: putative acetyltransferase [bacterium ADurb.Bin212]